ncbi:fasciclin domain protein, partial [Trifolium medium]|nr:fasciclin domain protein [Trifolium medium]
MINDFFSPFLLKTAKLWHLQATVATYIMGNEAYNVNITVTANDSVAVSNTVVRGI